MTTHFHTIIIGAGSGGLTAAVGLANFGKPTALIEAQHIGGDCTNVGCVPSKTLIHQVELHGDTHPATTLAEVRRKRDALRDREAHEFGAVPNLTLVYGRARLLSRTQVAVHMPDGDERIFNASNIVIATGARPRLLDIPGLSTERLLTNETVFEIPAAPRHLAVIGGGVIGMELAFAFRKLGSRVSVITSAPRIMDKFIPEVAPALEASMEAYGIPFYTRARALSYAAERAALQIEHHGQAATLDDVDYVLVAIGRQRNVEGLGLEAAGVHYSLRDGIPTDSFGRTNVANIYAIGDVTPTSAFTHSANAQGRRVVQRIALPFLPARAPEPFYPSATFSDPEVATAGMSRRMIEQRYHPALIKRIRVDLPTQTDRGYTDDLRHGFICIDAMRLTGQILGVTIVGPRASEMIAFFTLAIQEHISLHRIYRIVQAYPTFSSGIQKAADAFLRETLPNLAREVPLFLRYRWASPTA